MMKLSKYTIWFRTIKSQTDPGNKKLSKT